MSVVSTITGFGLPRAASVAPGTVSSAVHAALRAAIEGAGPLRGAAAAADRELAKHAAAGSRPADRAAIAAAVHGIVSAHVKLAGAQGFATNLGGLVTSPAAVPANLVGVTMLQCRMSAAIAHLHGHDLTDPGVRNAILTCVLGPDEVEGLVEEGTLPATPAEMAVTVLDTAASAALDRVVSTQVTAALLRHVTGRRAATIVAKRVPLVGGLIGGVGDARATRAIGRYADQQLAPPPQQHT